MIEPVTYYCFARKKHMRDSRVEPPRIATVRFWHQPAHEGAVWFRGRHETKRRRERWQWPDFTLIETRPVPPETVRDRVVISASLYYYGTNAMLWVAPRLIESCLSTSFLKLVCLGGAKFRFEQDLMTANEAFWNTTFIDSSDLCFLSEMGGVLSTQSICSVVAPGLDWRQA